MAVPMIVVETPVPEDIYKTLQALGLFRETLAERSRRLLALRFYQDRTLSLGKAARLAGLSRWDFIEFLADNNVPVIDYSDEELATEFAAVDQLEAELRQ
jgi:predicted HTH domain antitoxin